MDVFSLLPPRSSSVLLPSIQDSPSARFLANPSSPIESSGPWCREAYPKGQTNDVSARFGRRLRLLRQERRMTQSDMAKRFGIDRSYISAVERGHKSMTLAMLEVIALGMDITLSKLLENL
jgi:DNA-binding XRE family transcriptional regulator